MKAIFTVVNPEKIAVKLTLVMTIEEMRETASQMQDKWPSWKLSGLFNDVARHVESQYIAEDQEKNA